MRVNATAAMVAPTSPKPNTVTELPKSYGIVVFRAFEMLDVFGPLNALSMLAKMRQLNLYIISDTLDLVTTEPMTASMNSKNSSFVSGLDIIFDWNHVILLTTGIVPPNTAHTHI